MRWAGGGACAGDYAASLGEVTLPVAELTRRVAGLAGLATGLGLELDTLYLLQTAVRSGKGGERNELVEVRRLHGTRREAGRVTDQLSQEVTSRGRFLCVCESCGASSTKRRLSMTTVM